MSVKGQAWDGGAGVTKEAALTEEGPCGPGGTGPRRPSRTGPGRGMEGEPPWAGARKLGKVLAGSTEAGKGLQGWAGWGWGKLAVQPEEDKHDEEEAGPQLGQGIMVTALGEGDEGQAGPAGHTQHQEACPHTRVHVCVCLRVLAEPVCYSREHTFHPSAALSLCPPLVLGSCSVPSTAPQRRKVSYSPVLGHPPHPTLCPPAHPFPPGPRQPGSTHLTPATSEMGTPCSRDMKL